MEPYKCKNTMELLYKEHKTVSAVSKYLGVNYKTAAFWLKFHGINDTIRSQGARKHYCNHNFFSQIDTEGKAYWLGFLYADGCVYKGSDRSSYRLQVNLKKSDADMLEKFIQAIDSDYVVTYKNVVDKKTGKSYESATIKINSTIMCKDLINIGMTPRKSLVCEMPKINPELFRHFLRGYFDGDGCISSSGRKWCFSIVGGENMLQVFQAYFSSFDIFSGINKMHKSKAKSLCVCSHVAIKKIYRILYHEATVMLERKEQKFNMLLNKKLNSSAT